MGHGFPKRGSGLKPERRPVLLPVIAAAWLAGCIAAGPPGEDLSGSTVLARYAWEHPDARWRLPRPLREASGLVNLPPDQWIIHDDNVSTLWTFSGDLSEPPRISALRSPSGADVPAVDGDFEGVTVADGHVYLLGSRGTLLRARLDPGGAPTGPLRPVATGVEGRCNFEGLAARPDTTTVFYMACKYPREPLPGAILLYRIELRDPAAPPRLMRVDVSAVLSATGLERLRPSGLAWLPDPGRLLVLAGKERVILELDAGGTLMAWRRLMRRWHRQPEGLSVSPDGVMVVADEADGATATLTVYRPAIRLASPPASPPASPLPVHQ